MVTGRSHFIEHLQNPNLTWLNYSGWILKLSTFSTFSRIFFLVLFQCKRSSQYFLIKSQISVFCYGNSTAQSTKFACVIITKDAGEKDGSIPRFWTCLLTFQTLTQVKGFDKIKLLDYVEAEFKTIWPWRMLYIQDGIWLASYMLSLHLVCYLSGECSLKELFLFSSDVFPRV